MKNIIKFLSITIVSLFIIGCGSDSAGISITGTPTNSFLSSCDSNASYTPSSAVVRHSTSQTFVATVIAIHGKNGSPTASHMTTLATDLNAKGYDVVLPYMPWSGLNWDGTLCQGISYLKTLITTEKNAGNQVILLGHSLGGPITLAYETLSSTEKPDAIVSLAPGHFIHQSSVLANAHASSIATANTMISASRGDEVATFVTYNMGADEEINTTPNIYLSFHDTTKFPNIESSIPLVNSTPVLWLAATEDSLTPLAISYGFISLAGQNSNYNYQEISGGHLDLVSNVANPFDTWYQEL